MNFFHKRIRAKQYTRNLKLGIPSARTMNISPEDVKDLDETSSNLKTAKELIYEKQTSDQAHYLIKAAHDNRAIRSLTRNLQEFDNKHKSTTDLLTQVISGKAKLEQVKDNLLRKVQNHETYKPQVFHWNYWVFYVRV